MKIKRQRQNGESVFTEYPDECYYSYPLLQVIYLNKRNGRWGQCIEGWASGTFCWDLTSFLDVEYLTDIEDPNYEIQKIAWSISPSIFMYLMGEGYGWCVEEPAEEFPEDDYYDGTKGKPYIHPKLEPMVNLLEL